MAEEEIVRGGKVGEENKIGRYCIVMRGGGRSKKEIDDISRRVEEIK
ncbi:hypothetical protein [Staphylococcus saprophyticus]|nr:hypothetical protein [Staphylococcus saprophyticus]